MRRRQWLAAMPATLLLPSHRALAQAALPAAGAATEIWTFDNLDAIGGLAPTVEGAPRLVDSPFGRALAFDGVRDAVFLRRHPLAGCPQFTFEALFRPDGGTFAQRWFHLESDAGAQPADGRGDTRILFEIRVVGAQWYLDAFVRGPGYNQALVAPARLYPCGQWHYVAQSYDGQMFRSYVNGQLQLELPVAFAPQGPGAASIGTRMNRRDYFRGAVREARFSTRALPASALHTIG